MALHALSLNVANDLSQAHAGMQVSTTISWVWRIVSCVCAVCTGTTLIISIANHSMLQLDRRVLTHCRRVRGRARGRDPHLVLPGSILVLTLGLGEAVTGLLGSTYRSSGDRKHYLVLKGDVQLRQVYSGPILLAMVVRGSPLSACMLEKR